MPPSSFRICRTCLRASSSRSTSLPTLQGISYASTQATTPAPVPKKTNRVDYTLSRYPKSQPPSHRRPEERRSQIHRQYTSLLRSTPMMLLIQHNNLKASEWIGLRRELSAALAKVDASNTASGGSDPGLADAVRVQVIRSAVFAAALRIVEYYHPQEQQSEEHTHGLSRAAHEATINKKLDHALAPLLMGPLAVVTFPSVSTEHLKAALSVLSPKSPAFPAPSRKVNPSYWEPAVQSAVQKLMLLGARVEGTAFDQEGTRWVGKIEGGLDGLRGQLVATLQSIGGGVTSALEAAGNSLYVTVEARKNMMADEQGDKGIEN